MFSKNRSGFNSKSKSNVLSGFSLNQIEQDWKEYYPKVYAYFYKRVENRFEVEELTSLTMNTAFLARYHHKQIHHFNAYLWKVAHNYLVGFIKKKNLQPLSLSLEISELDQNQFVEFSSNNDTPWDANSEINNQRSKNYLSKLAQLKECIQNQLDKDDQLLIELTIYQEQNSRQVGQTLGIKPEAVRKRLQRALAKLRQHCTQLWQTLTDKKNLK